MLKRNIAGFELTSPQGQTLVQMQTGQTDPAQTGVIQQIQPASRLIPVPGNSVTGSQTILNALSGSGDAPAAPVAAAPNLVNVQTSSSGLLWVAGGIGALWLLTKSKPKRESVSGIKKSYAVPLIIGGGALLLYMASQNSAAPAPAPVTSAASDTGATSAASVIPALQQKVTKLSLQSI